MQGPSYEIRDPIHGLIELSEKELDIINTKVFQRLRRIRQLAMAFLVYPGTLHTRFDHSIGVMHIAGRICNRLKQCGEITDKECTHVRIAALLHDIGHGPFSHVSEYLLEQYVPNQTSEQSNREKIHERVTVDIVHSDSEIRKVLTTEERNFVVEMIEGKTTRDFRRDIISSDLDADKMDYLLRDSYFAGVEYGKYDLDKIIESCRVYQEGNESFLVINNQGIYALEQFLLAKHHMTQQVYRHKVRSITDAMIIRGIELAICGDNEEIKQLYQYKKTPEYIENYMKIHDERLIDILRNCKQQNCKQNKARDIFNRLYHRQLFKRVGEISLKDVHDALAQRRMLQIGDKQKREWEEAIANHIETDPDYVIINKLQIRNPNYGSRSYNLNPESIMVLDEKQTELRNLSRYSTELVLARPPADEAALETVQIYAPQNHWNTLSTSQRKLEQSQLQEKVQEILLSP